MCVLARETRAMSMKDARNQPTIVIDCAMAKGSRLAMLRSRATFAMSASASETEFTAMSLHDPSQLTET